MKRTILIISLLVAFITATGGYYAFKVKGGALASSTVVRPSPC